MTKERKKRHFFSFPPSEVRENKKERERQIFFTILACVSFPNNGSEERERERERENLCGWSFGKGGEEEDSWEAPSISQQEEKGEVQEEEEEEEAKNIWGLNLSVTFWAYSHPALSFPKFLGKG